MEKCWQLIKTHPKKSMGIALALTSLLFIRYKHTRLVYLPDMGFGKSPSKNPYPYKNPEEHGLSYDNVSIDSKDGTKLRGWYIKYAEQAKRIVVYFHENAGNIGTRLTYIKQIVKKTSSNVIIIAYRGYSDSQGSPSESGIKLDAQAILSWSINKSKQENLPLVILGRSLGGAATLHACSKYQERIQGVILQNTFTSIKDVALNLCPFVLKPLAHIIFLLVLTTKWRSIDLIKNIKVPILFVKSAKDQLIPISQMNQLSQKCESQKQQYVIRDGTHNETWILEHQTYFKKFNEFFRRLYKQRL